MPYDGTLYKWRPHYDDDNPCSLTCRGKPTLIVDTSTSENFSDGDNSGLGQNGINQNDGELVVRLSDKVHDGTRCRPGSLDMCIDGKCQVSPF